MHVLMGEVQHNYNEQRNNLPNVNDGQPLTVMYVTLFS